MKSIIYLFPILILSLFLVSSCGREKLTPFVNPVTINELRDDQAIKFSYKIDQTQIEEYAGGRKKFPIFGKLFQAIAFALANSNISSRGGHELKLDPVNVDLNSLGEIDFDFIEWISLDSLLVEVDGSTKGKDSLEFIEQIEIWARLEHPMEDLPINAEGYSRLLYFNKRLHQLNCEDKCLNLEIRKIKWKELIESNPQITLQPKIIINSVPKSAMTLAGSVSFSVKFKIGF